MYKAIKNSIYFSLLVFVAFHYSCQESILVGEDLLDDEKFTVEVVDTIPLVSSIKPAERAITHRPNLESRTYILGGLEDNIFGKLNAGLYLSVEQVAGSKPDYSGNVRFDSLVLVLGYDTLGDYGAAYPTHNIKLTQLSEAYTKTDTFYSDTNLPTQGTNLIDRNITIASRDSVLINNHSGGGTLKLRPQMRLRLPDEFGRSILENTMATQSDTAFANFIKGFRMEATPLSGSSTFGFILTDATINSANLFNKMVMYYTLNDTTKKEYYYPVNKTTINTFARDYTGSEVQNAITTPELAQNTTYIEGAGGVETIISFERLDYLRDKLVNKATIEIYVDDRSNTNNQFPPPLQIIASRKNDAGSFVLIDDIAQLVAAGVGLTTVFGGNLDQSGPIKKYTIDVTNHLKNSLKNSAYNSDLYIGILTSAETPRRATLFGAKHPMYPMKLKVSYSQN